MFPRLCADDGQLSEVNRVSFDMDEDLLARLREALREDRKRLTADVEYVRELIEIAMDPTPERPRERTGSADGVHAKPPVPQHREEREGSADSARENHHSHTAAGSDPHCSNNLNSNGGGSVSSVFDTTALGGAKAHRIPTPPGAVKVQFYISW